MLGSSVRLRIGDTEQEAIASDGGFERTDFAPGSSGWTNAQGDQTRWMELFLRSSSAVSCLALFGATIQSQPTANAKIRGYPNAMTDRLECIFEYLPVWGTTDNHL